MLSVASGSCSGAGPAHPFSVEVDNGQLLPFDNVAVEKRLVGCAQHLSRRAGRAEGAQLELSCSRCARYEMGPQHVGDSGEFDGVWSEGGSQRASVLERLTD